MSGDKEEDETNGCGKKKRKISEKGRSVAKNYFFGLNKY